MQICLGDLVVIKVQVYQEYIKLIFEKVGHKVMESTEEMDEDDVEIKQEVKMRIKRRSKKSSVTSLTLLLCIVDFRLYSVQLPDL